MGGAGVVLVVGPVVGGTGVGFPIFHFIFFHLPLYFLPTLPPPSSLPCPSGPSDQPTNGRLVPSGSTDLEMMTDSHDYDEVPMEDTTEEEEVGWWCSCVVCVCCVCLLDLTCTFAYWQSTSVAAVPTPKEGEVVAAEQFEPSLYAEDTSELTEKLRKTEVCVHQ